MKKIILKIGLFMILAMIILPTAFAFAANDTYKVLVPLPGVGDKDGTTKLQDYVPAMFKLAIGLATVAAVLMIVIGGFQYMTSDAIQGKSEGKSRIQNAIIGLVLVIGAWIILYTVNPNLLTLNLNIDSATTTSPPGADGTLSPALPTNSVMEKIAASCPGCATSGGLQYNISQANLAKFDCQNCKPFDSSIPFSGNTNINVDLEMGNKLLALNNGLKQQDVSWQVTEAFPPIVNHASGCHYTGNCVDAKPINATGANLKRFIETSKNNGLGAQYEVKTVGEQQSVIASLKAAGMTGDLTTKVIVVPTINGAHFSVYNCSSNPTKCN